MASARRVGTNENVSTYDSGGGFDYTAFATWEAATDTDLVTATTSEVLECQAGTHADNLSLVGATTSALYFRICRPAAGAFHGGDPTAGVIVDKATGGSAVMFIGEDNASVQDLVLTANTSNLTLGTVHFADPADDASVVGILGGNFGAETRIPNGCRVTTGATDTVNIIDCVFADCTSDGIFADTGNVTAYNVTASGNTLRGFNRTTGTFVAKNCLGTGNATADFAGTFDAASIANLSSDTSAPGIGPLISQVVAFTDADGYDFSLTDNDTTARGRGVNLSADAAYAFDDDLILTTILPTWSIGASWTVASARRTAINENVSTYDSAGGKDYTALATWEAATDINLVTATQSEILECYGGPHDDNITLAGATTNARYFRIIRPAAGEGHAGTSNTGVHFACTSDAEVFLTSEAFCQIQDLVISANFNSATHRSLISFRAANCLAVGCIGFDSANSGAGALAGISGTAAGDDCGIIACVIDNIEAEGIFVAAGQANNFYYNNTLVDCGTRGINNNDATTVVKNTLAKDNPTADFDGAVAAASTTNSSSDGTAVGTSPRVEQTFTFVSEAGDDWHLAGQDAGAMNFGTDLSADSLFAFNDDIDGDLFDTWDIGADENDPAGAGVAEERLLLLLGVGF